MNALLLAPDAFEDTLSRFEELIYGTLIPIIFAVLGAVFVIIGIIRASKIALAEDENEKKKAIKGLIWFFIGAVLCFVVAFIIPVIVKYLGSRPVFPNPEALVPAIKAFLSSLML